MKHRLIALTVLVLGASYASADTLVGTIDVSGILSMDEYGDTDNVFGVFDIDGTWAGYSNFRLTGIGWDVDLYADSPSWLSEIAVSFENTSHANAVWLTPGVGDDFPGSASYSSGGIVDLVGLGLDFSLD